MPSLTVDAVAGNDKEQHGDVDDKARKSRIRLTAITLAVIVLLIYGVYMLLTYLR